MSRFPRLLCALTVALAGLSGAARADGDAARGEKLFARCKVCHAVGSGAKNKVGPALNGVIGRTAGTVEGYRYSAAMKQAGEKKLVWSAAAIDAYLADPRNYIKGNKMSFPGLSKKADRDDVIAYLRGFGPAGAAASGPATKAAAETKPAAPAKPRPLAKDVPLPSHGVLHLGRRATSDEIAAWDIDVRPDGTGLPEGKGTAEQGEAIFTQRCASCHGDFGEGRDRWPVLAGGFDSLKSERPVKTIGSYWPYLSTVYDYVRRAMPFGDARALTDDQVYAVTAYLLYLNDIVKDTKFELSKKNFTTIRLPNEANFKDDDRRAEPQYAAKSVPCMKNCKTDVRILNRARVLDVTPEDQAKGSRIE